MTARGPPWPPAEEVHDGRMKDVSRGKMSCLHKYCFLALAAIEFLMSFTFLGYVHIEPISVTIAYLPILIAGCFLGVGQSAAMGLFFGLASMYKASANYVMPMDKIFSPFASGAPVASLLLSVGVRTLFGWAVGVFFLLGRRSRHPRLWTGVVAVLSPKLHSALVYAAMGLLFPQLGYGLTTSFRVSLSDVPLALLCLLVIEALWFFRRGERLSGFGAYLERTRDGGHRARELHWSWLLFLLCVLGAAVATTFYFAQRMTYMLGVHGLVFSETVEYDLLHLQLQSLFATLSLDFLLAVCMLVVYRYLSYREYVGQLDAITGVMGRKMFNRYCEEQLRGGEGLRAEGGWFLFVDVDYFKSINDTLGHPVGDMVLKRIAQTLESVFSTHGDVGRMGGDEFAVLIAAPLPKEALCRKLERFLGDISTVLAAPETVSCSIGACRFSGPQRMQTLYAQTDRLLYAAKRHGRACYVLGALKNGELELLED